jgi:hypothetical protein
MRRSGTIPITLVVVALAGCGSSATIVTTRQPAVPSRKSAAIHKTELRRTPTELVCTKHVTVNTHASCGFAENVLSAYASATNEENGVTTLGVESPATGKIYSVECKGTGYHRIGCTTTDAKVAFGWTEVGEARGRHSAQVASTAGLWGGQSRTENEEAGCKYGFTVSDTTPHCNTQEEGVRIQEDDQSEREDPQREAENEQAGTEVRSHEECVVQLGVNAC